MSILNKVWNHYDAWANVKALNSSMTWEQILNEISKHTVRGYDTKGEFCHLIAGADDQGNPFAMTSLNHQVACMMEYRRWGQQTVVVGPEMQEAFADTELGKVPASHLKFPFPTYWIAFPDNEEMKIWGGSPEQAVTEDFEGFNIMGTGWHRVEGAYVVDLKDVKANSFLVYLWGPKPIDPDIVKKNEEHGYVKRAETDDQAHLWFSVTLSEDKDIEQTIIDTFSDPLNEVFDMHPSDPNKNLYSQDMLARNEAEVSRVVTETAIRITRIIVNSALYMTSPRAEITSMGSTKRDELLNQAKDLRDQAERTSGKASRNWRRQAERKENKAKRYKPPVTWIAPKIEQTLSGRSKGVRGANPSKQKGHLRKGHWHLFRTGRMTDDAGEKIPNDLRTFVYHWIPPTWCGDLDTKHEKHTHAFREV